VKSGSVRILQDAAVDGEVGGGDPGGVVGGEEQHQSGDVFRHAHALE